VRAAMPDALLVFLMPPDDAELARRLAGRGTENAEQISRRLRIAAEELAAKDEFDIVIVNDTIDRAAQRLVELLQNSAASGARDVADES
jgi:guanylate kinase